MAKLKPKDLAQQTAVRGETDVAIEQFQALLAAGDLGAAASLAEIAAFRGRWPDVLRHAYTFMRKPDSVHAGNVLKDITNLVAVTGFKNGDWSAIQAEVTAIRTGLLADPTLAKYVDGTSRMSSQVDHLIELAGRAGKLAYNPDLSDMDTLDEDARAAKVDDAVAWLSMQKDAPKNDAERRREHFGYAVRFKSHSSALRLYDDGGIGDHLTFAPYAFTASALSRAGRTDDAWRVIRHGLRLWWPVDLAQVAPVVLLSDEGLRSLMTPERCEEVLRTPRGPAAVPPKPKKK